jgi:hypothetical protein
MSAITILSAFFAIAAAVLWDLVPHVLHDVLLHRHLYCGRGIRDTLEDRRFTQQRSPVRVFARK